MCQRKVFLSSHEKALFFECLPLEICIVEMSEQPQFNPLLQTDSQEEGGSLMFLWKRLKFLMTGFSSSSLSLMKRLLG